MEKNIYDEHTDVVPTKVQWNLDRAMDYGEMPDAALMSKFEETADLSDGEDQYDDYAREIAKDRSVDAIGLESDEPRRNYNAKGFLNMRYDGGRGEFNDPRHPEAFFELTEMEPRHGMTDPDFKRLVEQERFRAERYIRYDADADNSVHEGRWSEPGAFYRARYAVQKAIQPRALVFSTSKDGRREGLRRDAYPHRSYVNKVEEDMERIGRGSTDEGKNTFAEFITDFALNPQRRTTKISNEIIRNSRMYQQFTTDHEFAVAKYGQDSRKRRLKSQQQSYLESYDQTDNRGKLMDGDDDAGVEGATVQPKAYKAAGIVMGAMVDQRTQVQHDGDSGSQGRGDLLDAQIRKHEALKKDLSVVLWEAKPGHEKENFANQSEMAQMGKMAAPQERAHLARVQESSHAKPAHHYINAEIMYKSANGKIDPEIARRSIVRDGTAVDRSETIVGARKTRRGVANGAASGNKTQIAVDGSTDSGNNLSTVSYKKGKNGVANQSMQFARAGLAAAHEEGHGEQFKRASESKGAYKYAHVNYRVTDKNDVSVDEKGFYDNMSKERHLGSMNTDKYGVWRNTRRDVGIGSGGFDS